MKIVEIHIYGYGKLENIKITNLQDITVFFGENEAGKSTIMSFIHSILFGFPTRQQTELRYEPKMGAKYGGQLTLFFQDKGRVVVERVKGKATGDVSVHLDDGTIGGEELLAKLLFQMDRGLFQSIFSFNLHGLQNVHQMKREDLGKFLFSTGAVGTEQLYTVEKTLQKELDERFKPQGKNPLINVKLKEVKELHERLKKAEQQNEHYEKWQQEKTELESSIQHIQGEMEGLQKKLHRLEEWKKLEPIVKEKQLLAGELKSEESPFPIDGMNRLEQLQQVLQPLEGQISAITERLTKIVLELNQYKPLNSLLEKEDVIFRAIEKVSLYETYNEELKEFQQQRDQLLAEQKELKERLHIPIDNAQLAQCNTSIFMKDQTFEAEKKQQRLEEKKHELDERFSVEKEGLEQLERQMQQIEKELLSESEVNVKRKRIASFMQKDVLERELQSVQDKIHLLEITNKREKEQSKRNRIHHLFLGALFLFLMIWGFTQSNWGLAGVGIVGLAFILFLQTKKKESQEIEKELTKWREQRETLREQLQQSSSAEIDLLEEQLQRNTMLQEELNILKLKWEQQETQFTRVVQVYEDWEKEFLEHKEYLQQLGRELYLPDEISLKHLHTAFLLLVKLKDGLRSLERLDGQINHKKKAMEKIQAEIVTLQEEFLEDKTLSLREAAYLLKERVKEEERRKQKYDSLLERKGELKEQLEGLQQEYEHLLRQRQALYQKAGVETEEDFRFAGKMAEKTSAMKRKIEELTKQIHLSSLGESHIQEFMKIEDLQLEVEEVSRRIEELNRKKEELHQLYADLNHRIAVLEEGGEYGELLHKFKQLQTELNQEAREWAKFQLAKEWLQKTVERYKKEHLPSMLLKAEEYLSFLTDGNYVHIHPKTEGDGFLIERKDQLFFEANELSQATTEQVYVALRLALATTIYKKYPFPIIIDDSFVNFDKKRTQRVIELVKRIQNNQILYFTCHEHLLSYFKEEEIVLMTESVRA